MQSAVGALGWRLHDFYGVEGGHLVCIWSPTTGGARIQDQIPMSASHTWRASWCPGDKGRVDFSPLPGRGIWPCRHFSIWAYGVNPNSTLTSIERSRGGARKERHIRMGY